MAVITEKILEDILSYLEKSINNLAKEAFENLGFDKKLHSNYKLEKFQNQQKQNLDITSSKD